MSSVRSRSLQDLPSLDALCHFACIEHDTHRSEARTVNYSYNEVQELIEKRDSKYGNTIFVYDESGNMLVRIAEGTEVDAFGYASDITTSYSFDTLGRLEAVSEGGRLLLGALYDGDNNRVFSATRAPDIEDERALSTQQYAPVIADLSEDATESPDTATNLRKPVQTGLSEYDLFFYGVAQGITNLSHMTSKLTVWLNSLWTLDIESERSRALAQDSRARHARELAELIAIPDAPALDSESSTEITDAINEHDYIITRYINDVNTEYPRTLAEYNEHGKWQQSYIWGNGLLAMNTNTTAEQLLTDGRGSITEAISATSTTTYSYDAFGNVTREGTSSNPFTYNQERFDSCANLQYLRARYVDLELSRFISRDTVLGTPEDPRTHNLYLYVQNDPLSHIDPSGNIAFIRRAVAQIRNCFTCRNGTVIIPANFNRQRCRNLTCSRPLRRGAAIRCMSCNNGLRLRPGGPRCNSCFRSRAGPPQRSATIIQTGGGGRTTNQQQGRHSPTQTGGGGAQPSEHRTPSVWSNSGIRIQTAMDMGRSYNPGGLPHGDRSVSTGLRFIGEILIRDCIDPIRVHADFANWGHRADVVIMGGSVIVTPYLYATSIIFPVLLPLAGAMQILAVLSGHGITYTTTLRATFRYSEIVVLHEAATSYRRRVTTSGRSQTGSIAAYGTATSARLAASALEAVLRDNARRTAQIHGQRWALSGIESHPNRTTTRFRTTTSR